MAKRTRADQSAHDKAVERIARRHDKDGWKVQADVAGWPTPDTIAGRRPDIIATKTGSRRIIEVETDPDDDRAQHEKFRRHAGQKANTYFEVVVVDAAGRKRATFN